MGEMQVLLYTEKNQRGHRPVKPHKRLTLHRPTKPKQGFQLS